MFDGVIYEREQLRPTLFLPLTFSTGGAGRHCEILHGAVEHIKCTRIHLNKAPSIFPLGRQSTDHRYVARDPKASAQLFTVSTKVASELGRDAASVIRVSSASC